MYLSLSAATRGRDTIAEIAGDIDRYSGRWLRRCLLRFQPPSGSRLVIDLSRVTFIDVAGLRMLLASCREAGRQGCLAGFSALSAPVRRVAEVTGLCGALPLAAPSAGPGQRPGPPAALVYCALPPGSGSQARAR